MLEIETPDSTPSVSLVTHLIRASAIVSSWPEWKRNVLGSIAESEIIDPKLKLQKVPEIRTELERFSGPE